MMLNNIFIEKKAYFGRRDIRRITIPESVQAIGDWAFASCRNLEEVEFEREDTVLGKAVFQKCEKLRRICVKGKHEDVAYLLGAVPVRLGEPYLLDLSDAGSKRWLEQFDAVLLARLGENEMEGFAGQFVCGEEDSGRKNEDDYREERRRWKAELAYLRLIHPLGISSGTAQVLRRYLCEHRRGCVSEAAWRTLLSGHGTDMEYAQVYIDVAKEQEDQIFDLDAHLKDIGEELPELKAFFLKYSDYGKAGNDFFGLLDLDL